MLCFCCGNDVQIGRKAKVRRWVDFHPSCGGPDSAAYKSYCEAMTYRWSVVCPRCYAALDGETGGAVIGGHFYTMSCSSCCDKARTLTEAQYRTWQRRE